jgi:type 1 fimbriae regulatory protein FimB/type 1 fimbriae regulatory protein FimE
MARPPYSTRQHLTSTEIDRLKKAAACNPRNLLLIHLAYHHALRVSELLNLKWSDIDLENRTIYVRRLKGSESAYHPLSVQSHTLLMEHHRKRPESAASEPSQLLFTIGSNAVYKITQQLGLKAKIAVPVHPHMLRHSAGFALVNKNVDLRVIQEYLGHKNVQHTVRYTKLAEGRFSEAMAAL